ncbi:saccharopine dehydrogenase family protein [Anoxynatronum buryatiense]|uniref:Saccharopine dehydrogenase, NADP-dependent n=1 Tax=Anoxynatronum buryatiense TaxID=489973 RepID=A0AA45WTQ4_9CLOT|nr:saccharopine dehydrogenase C-terminal domain-containing protein [Anoxynatronum buryatiense]SMP42672.1 Saccharopine dehydrogenase, NADP-dependent [Anoxynatronum buryatiense]
MKVLLIGVGGVGEAIASIADKRDFLELMVLADYNLDRAKEVQAKLGNPEKYPVEQVDARDGKQIQQLVKKYGADIVVNGCEPAFNESIFDAAYEAGCNYMDMAMTLSHPHPEAPYEKSHIKLGDYQFDRAQKWEEKGLLALVGSGVEPGMADVFARYAHDHLFDEIDEIGIRDGNNLQVEGYTVPFGFSIWTTIEECLNPPVIWERDKGWYTTEPFSGEEVFDLPEVGPVEMVNVEHEEVLLVPRYLDKGLKRVTFKFGLGRDFITMLKNLQELGLASTEKVKVNGVEVSPRDVVAATAPNPAYIGPKMTGKTVAGTWVTGRKDGLDREIYLYQVADNQECMKIYGSQAVVAQTAFPPVLMMELVAKGQWKATGVQGPEFFPPEPFMELMAAYDFPYGLQERDSAYKAATKS